MTLTDVTSISPVNLSPSEQRQYRVVCAALYCYYNADRLFYTNVRGQALKDQWQPPPYVPHALDCSAFVTYCYRVAGAEDPNGHGYDPNSISTAELWSNGQLLGGSNTSANGLIPGDLCFYAYGSLGQGMHGGMSEHVAVYISQGKVVSMGSDEGPLVLDYNVSSKPLFGVRRYKF